MSLDFTTAKPLFTQEFPSFGPFDREALRRLVRSLGKSFKRILEVGSWLGGGSTRVFIEELKGGHGLLYCVDTWQGTPGVEQHQEICKNYDVLGTFRYNVAKAGGVDIVKQMVMSSLEAAAIVADRTFDLVFLDGDHSYQATRADIRAWLPKVTPGGILCGHDCEARLTAANQELILAHRDQEAIPGEGRFRHYHPGVILAVHEVFGDTCHLWAEEELTLPDGARGAATVWDVVIVT